MFAKKAGVLEDFLKLLRFVVKVCGKHIDIY